MVLKPFVSLVFIFTLFSFTVYASPTIRFGSTPSWVSPVHINSEQPNLREINDGYYLDLYEQQESLEKDETYKHTIKQIISDAGVQSVSNISINFNPSYEQLTVHKIVIWRDGQLIDKLQKNGFKIVANEGDLSMFIYNGNYTAYLILEDVRKGDKLEVSYTISGSNPVFNKKFFNSFTFQGSDPVVQFHYSILVPVSRKLDFKYNNNAPKPAVTQSGNSLLYDWTLLNVKGLAESHQAPAWFFPFPFVEISEYKSWGEVINWGCRINTPEENLNGALAKRIELLKNKYGKDSAGLFRAIVEIVQNEVRYMGVEIGTYSHKANAPEKVYGQRYGDCKDKAMLLVSMLHSVAIKAEMALVHTGCKARIENDIPSPSSFNHAIALAHLSGKDIWVDATWAGQGGTGTDFYCPAYGKALVLTPGGSALTSIPDMPGGATDYTEEYEWTEVGRPASFTVYTTYTGSKADDMRYDFANKSRTDMEKSFLDYYSKTYAHIESADSLLVSDEKSTNTLATTEHYRINDFFEYDSVNHNYPVSFYADLLRSALPVVGNKKEYPIALSYPYKTHYTIHVDAPISWHISPAHQEIRRNAYSFSYDVSAQGTRLTIEYELSFFKDHIAPDEIAEYEKDRKKIVNDYLSYSFTDTPASENKFQGKNYWAILAIIALLGGCVFGAIKIYTTPTARAAYFTPNPRQLGGWLLLPLFGLVVSIFRIAYYLLSGDFYSNAIWRAYDGMKESTAYKILLSGELIGNNVNLCLHLFCLVLMLKKRDILPKYIIITYAVSAAIILIDSYAAHWMFSGNAIEYKDIFRNLVGLCIWVPYFTRSSRVKETFVIPYPASANG